jgi:hypothetical protein
VKKLKKYSLVISPAIPPEERYEIEKTIKKLGYKILGSGTCMDMSSCDIAFQGKDDEPYTCTSKGFYMDEIEPMH